MTLFLALCLIIVPSASAFFSNAGYVSSSYHQVESKDFSPPSSQRCKSSLSMYLEPDPIRLAESQNHGDAKFWRKSRTKEEIVEYCARNIFPHENLQTASKRIHVVTEELPLVVIQNFLSDDMCEEIIEAALERGDMVRSTTAVAQRSEQTDSKTDDASFKTSDLRTSSTTWLREDHCEIPLRILAGRASRISGIPATCMENLQVVRYNGNGEKFDMHTDHVDSFNNLECRGRLATCLLYLNSAESEDGNMDGREGFSNGGTYFPEYGISIKPTKGTAVFWFNTIEKPGMDDYQYQDLTVDLRSRHAGEPVYGGEKWVCNRWIHPIPFGADVRDEIGLTRNAREV